MDSKIATPTQAARYRTLEHRKTAEFILILVLLTMADSATPKKTAKVALTWSDMKLPKEIDLESLLSLRIDDGLNPAADRVLWAKRADLACSIFCNLFSPPHPFHPQAKITWEPCSDLPVGISEAQTVVIGDRIYCGGGTAAANRDEYVILCYSLSEDTWATLPTCPVRYVGLGQVGGKLVTVGGVQKSVRAVVNQVYDFDEVTQTWEQSIPSMFTARYSPAVLSYRSALIVAGGHTGHTRTTAVEVFREETSQWHMTESLPFCWHGASSEFVNNTWYLLGGGTERDAYSNRAVCAHVDLLLGETLPPDHDQAWTDRDSPDDSIWHVLPNTPLYGSAAATFGTSLLAVGGSTTSNIFTNPQVPVHVYAPSTNTWIHISNLPIPLADVTTVMLSPTELLVIGGWNGGYLNTLYKGLLWFE